MSALLEDLHRAAFTITPLITKPEYAHMKQAWEMVLGGLIAPAMAAEDPSCVEGGTMKALLDRYTPDKVKAFFTPRKEVVERRTHEVIIKKVPTPGEMHRRIKGEVKKETKKEDNLTCNDRDIAIRWWNENQRTIPEDDPTCIRLSVEMNTAKSADMKQTAPYQVAGYISHLSRMGMKTGADRERVFNRSIKKAKHTVMPVYSEAFITALIEHCKEARAAKEKGKVERARIRAERGLPPLEEVKVETVSTGLVPDASRVPAPVEAVIPVPAPVDKPKRKRAKKAKEPAIVTVTPPVAAAVAPLPAEPVVEAKPATPAPVPVIEDPLDGLC